MKMMRLQLQLDERVRAGHGGEFIASLKKLAAVYFTVEEVYDQTPNPEVCRKTDFLKIGCTPFSPFLQKIPESFYPP